MGVLDPPAVSKGYVNASPAGVVGANRFNPATGFYNLKASNTKKLRGAMGKAVAGSAPATLGILGDSNSAGAVLDPAVNSYPSRLLDLLEAAGIVIAGTGYVLPTNNTSQDSRMACTYTISASAARGPSIGRPRGSRTPRPYSRASLPI
jgi:hypothetical protein